MAKVRVREMKTRKENYRLVRELVSKKLTAPLFLETIRKAGTAASGDEILRTAEAIMGQVLKKMFPGREEIPHLPHDTKIEELRKKFYISALIRTKGNKVEAAKLLGVSNRGIYYHIKELNIDCDRETIEDMDDPLPDNDPSQMKKAILDLRIEIIEVAIKASGGEIGVIADILDVDYERAQRLSTRILRNLKRMRKEDF